jgi:hypothetical protein
MKGVVTWLIGRLHFLGVSRTYLAYSSFFAVKNDLRYIICHTLVETNMMIDRMLNHCTLDDVDSEVSLAYND